MAKLKLTSAFCRDVTCPPGKRKEVYRCVEQTGFGIEVRASGKKTFWLYYTKPDGKAAPIKIGGAVEVPVGVVERERQQGPRRVVASRRHLHAPTLTAPHPGVARPVAMPGT